MAKIPISKLPKATSAGANDEVPVVQDDVTKKVTIGDIGKEVNEVQEYSGLNSTDKTIIGAINEISSKPQSSDAEDVSYDNTESGLEATNVQDAIDEVNTKIEDIPSVDAYTKQESDSFLADEYDATQTYDVGDYCIYEGGLYVCNTAISTAEAWNASHWTLTDVATALENKADASAIPTKTSQLQNDSGFATMQAVEQALPALAEPIVEELVPIAVGDNYYDKTAIDNKLDPINTALNNKVDNSVLVHNKNAESLWEVGSIAYNDGHNESKTTRLRTKTYIDRNAQISVASGYLYELVAYNKGTYVGIWNGSTFAKAEAWNSGDIILGELGSYDFRLVMSKATPETETTADYNKAYIITITDATGTTYGIPADAGKTGEDISTLKGGLDDVKSEVLIEKPALEFNGYILSNTGNVSSSSYGKCTDFIDIGKFDRVDWNTANGNASVARVAFYDENKAYLSALTVNDGTSGTLDLSDDSYSSAKFVRLTYYDYPGKDLSGYNGRLYKSDSIAKSTEVLNKLNGIDRGVNVLIFGDSITDCASFTIVNDKTTVYNMAGTNSYVDGEGHTITYKMWAKLFGEFVPCAEIRNYACSGASYQDQVSPSNPRKDLSYQMTLALNDLDNPNGAFVVDDFVPDVIIFALGTNDGQPDDAPADAYAKIVTTASGIDIDATLSALDKSKFCEAVLWAYFTARKNFPYALIMNVLPLQRMLNENPTGELHTYLQEISQKYGGAVIVDGAYESGIVRENNVKSGLGATLKDGLHPNEKGQNMLARLIIGKYKSYYVPFDYMNP